MAVLQFQNKVRPLITAEISQHELVWFTKKEIIHATMQWAKLQNIVKEMKKVQGWGLDSLIAEQVSIEIGKCLKRRDKNNLPVYRSYPVPGGSRRYMRFDKMQYSHLKQCFAERKARTIGTIGSLQFDAILIKLLSGTGLEVKDILPEALEIASKEGLESAKLLSV